MNKSYCASVLLALVVVAHSQIAAQPVITEADLRAQFTGQLTVAYYDASNPTALQSLAQLSGGNRTWDFSAGQFDQSMESTVSVVSPPVPGSDDPDFASANFIIKHDSNGEESDSLVYTFARLTAGGLELLGMHWEGAFSDDAGAQSVTAKFRPPYLAMKLPLSMGTTWTADTEFHMDMEGWPVTTMKDSSWVDGWGTLVTPHGSAEALRVMSRNIVMTSIEVPGLPPFVYQDTTLSFEFMTRSGLSASLTLDENGEVQFASYSVTSGGGGLAAEPHATLPETFELMPVYPNPFNPQAVVPYVLHEPGLVTLQVLDLQGRLIATLVDHIQPSGHYTAYWQPVGMASGIYLVRLSVNGRPLTRKVSLVK